MSISARELLAAAEALRPSVTADRRRLHARPEVGACLPETKAYVMQRLREMGYAPQELCESGVVATVTGADTGRCILLRADMDALQVREETELDFRAENDAMHACGHDLHTAMLLGAAQLLQTYRSELQGTVKLVFQPDEEGFTGAKAMLGAGVLEDPRPGAALALHVHSGSPTGLMLWGTGPFMAGCTLFRITVRGVGCHGAMPETGVDPIHIAAHVYLAIEEILTREIAAKKPAVLTVGRFAAGDAPNVIPQEAVLEGTIRTFDRSLSEQILRRIGEIAARTAEAFRGAAETEELASSPPLLNDPDWTARAARCAEELFGSASVHRMAQGGMGSEDFASFTYELPSAYFLIGAGAKTEDPLYGAPMHNKRVVFNEEVLTRGAAFHACCALRWLEEAAEAAQ